mgnify:CR=1 FL=1
MNISLLGNNGIITKKIYNNNYCDKKFITKLLHNNNSNEINISKIISEIKHFDKYCYPLIIESQVLIPMFSDLWCQINSQYKKKNLYAFNCINGGYDLFLIKNDATLFNKFKDTILNTKYLLQFIKKICIGIQFLHKHKIVHNDIKLENLVMSFSNNYYSIRIIDFGLSDVYPFKRFLKSPLGTPGYIPINNQDFVCGYKYYPNDWNKGSSNKYTHMSDITGILKYTYATDIFSLGISLRTLLDNLSNSFFFGDKNVDFYDLNFGSCFCQKKIVKLYKILEYMLIERVQYRHDITSIIKSIG